jgi:hypothetical protein
MREEYDFSGGVRGRHAARFTADERSDLFRRAAVEDVQTWMMIALYEVQALEAALFTLLLLAENRPPARALAEAAALVDREAPRSLGEDLDLRLAFVAKERNWLVRRAGFASHAVLAHAEKAPALLARLQHLVAETRELRSHVDALVSQHLSSAGLSMDEVITRRDDAIGVWQDAA